MQALALWDVGLKRWNEKRAGKSTPEKRPGVTVNRRDLVAIPIPDANLLWRDLHVRDVQRVEGRQRTSNIRIDLVVEPGVTRGRPWTCGLEFDYANEESFYCRPLRLSEDGTAGRMPVPDDAGGHADRLPPADVGAGPPPRRASIRAAVNVRIGEGRTADVLRNLCFRIHEEEPSAWTVLVDPHPESVRRGVGHPALRRRARRDRDDLPGTGHPARPVVIGPGVCSRRCSCSAYMYGNPGAVLPPRRARRAPGDPAPARDLPAADRSGAGDRQPGHRRQPFRSAAERGGGPGRGGGVRRPAAPHRRSGAARS